MTDLRALTKRPIRWAAVPAAVVVALPTVALAPAQAEVTWSGCDTDRFKATAKYKGKVELTIIQRAKGCMEYHTLSDGRTCGVLTSYETSQAVEVKLGRAEQVRKWGPVLNSLPEKTQTNCNSLGENTGLFRVKEKFTGRYKIDLKAQKDPHAVPGLTVIISAANGQDSAESIVDTRKTGSWKFSKDNNKSKTKPTDKKKNKKSKNPSPDNSEPTPSTPLIPNGGSMQWDPGIDASALKRVEAGAELPPDPKAMAQVYGLTAADLAAVVRRTGGRDFAGIHSAPTLLLSDLDSSSDGFCP